MTGGILQLVSYGVQDIFLTNNPQISFFKTVYRRYTNFSREEFDLKFNNNLDFGTEAICNIKRYGDLLHRLFLVIQLPQINAKYNNILNGDITSILNNNNILLDKQYDNNKKFNIGTYKDIKKTINNNISDCERKLDALNYIQNNNNIETILSYSDINIQQLYSNIKKKLNDKIYDIDTINNIKNII
jgi:hypothetical protein